MPLRSSRAIPRFVSCAAQTICLLMTWFVLVLYRRSLPEIFRSLRLADLVLVFWRAPACLHYRCRTFSVASLEKISPSLVVAIFTTPRSTPRNPEGSAGSMSGVSMVA